MHSPIINGSRQTCLAQTTKSPAINAAAASLSLSLFLFLFSFSFIQFNHLFIQAAEEGGGGREKRERISICPWAHATNIYR
jgi:hypothetical protein